MQASIFYICPSDNHSLFVIYRSGEKARTPWLWHEWWSKKPCCLHVGNSWRILCVRKSYFNSYPQGLFFLRQVPPCALNPLMFLIDLKVFCLSLEMSPSLSQVHCQATRINTLLRLSILDSKWLTARVRVGCSFSSELRTCWNPFTFIRRY